MKKFGITLLAVLFVSSFALASPPVPPGQELSLIQTTTDIQCVGDVIETQSYSNIYVNDGDVVSPAGTNNAILDAYFDALEDADPLGLNNAGGENDALFGGDPDTPYPFGEAPVLYGTVPGSDGQTWRGIAGYPGNVALNATLAAAPSHAFTLAGGIGAEEDFPGLPDVDAGLGRGDSIAEINYEQEFTATGGLAVLDKSFTATDADTPNLEVSKDFAYEAFKNADGTYAIGAKAEMDERASMVVVSYGQSSVVGGIDGALALCPWVQPDGTETGIPATNENVAGGSSFDAQLIVGETNTAITTTAIPSFNYGITASGSVDGQTVGIGRISAAFAVQLQEGLDPYVPPTTRTVYVDALGNTVAYDASNTNDVEALFEGRIVAVTVGLPGTGIPRLGKFEQYEEFAEASGLWTFSKQMSYNSILPDTGSVSGDLIDGILP